MSPASFLLRIVLMFSLLLNGLSAALASSHQDMALQAAGSQPMDHAGMADCHHHGAGMAAADGSPQTEAPGHDAHSQIKDCLRSCAQHPLLAVLPLPFLASPGPSPAPPVMAASGLPAPPLPPLSRPPIG